MDGTAESILHSLQQVLLEAAQAVRPGPSDAAGGPSRAAMARVERTYGVKATHYGRLLSDLVAGSYAWDLFEKPSSTGSRLPRIYELSQCEPLLQVMRESGELAERERLLRERDTGFVAVWQKPSLTEVDRRLETEALYDDYFAGVRRVAEAYRPRYEDLRKAASGYVAPLLATRSQFRPLLQPPLMALLFHACHMDKDGHFLPFLEGAHGGMEYRHGPNTLQVLHPEPPPVELQRTDADREAIRAWVATGLDGALTRLDEMAWDIAAIAVSAFYARTPGEDIDSGFPLLIDDYFHWRGIDPRKRTPELRKEIDARLQLLCSDRMQLYSRTDLWITDPETGRRRKTPVTTEGSFLVKRSRFFCGSPAPRDLAHRDVPDGYLLSLGDWARKFVEERAMLGVFFKRLAEYDLRRQQWERRIGWYLVFQMNNQASKMRFQDVVKDGRTRTVVTTQHPLRMRTVLDNSHVPWEEMARTNPGKVIKQWCEALETLRRDGLLSDYSCLDGAVDGADLPPRGRLAAMLEHRYQFLPGKSLLHHLRAKKNGAERRRAR